MNFNGSVLSFPERTPVPSPYFISYEKSNNINFIPLKGNANNEIREYRE